MERNISHFIRNSFVLLFVSIIQINAQTIAFPSQSQPGTAELTSLENEFTFSNNLFSAKFVKNDDKLLFDGSNELGLAAGTELFKINLGDDSEVKASEMTLKNIIATDLVADPYNVKGAFHLGGGKSLQPCSPIRIWPLNGKPFYVMVLIILGQSFLCQLLKTLRSRASLL